MPRRRHDEHEPCARFLHDRDRRLEGPGLDGARRHPTASAARSSSRRTSPTFTSGSATATIRTPDGVGTTRDRKSTRLNSSHSQISYAVFCLKKKNKRRATP